MWGSDHLEKMVQGVEVDKKYKWLIHNYGAGAGGYQGSFGLSKLVVDIMEKELSKFKSKL